MNTPTHIHRRRLTLAGLAGISLLVASCGGTTSGASESTETSTASAVTTIPGGIRASMVLGSPNDSTYQELPVAALVECDAEACVLSLPELLTDGIRISLSDISAGTRIESSATAISQLWSYCNVVTMSSTTSRGVQSVAAWDDNDCKSHLRAPTEPGGEFTTVWPGIFCTPPGATPTDPDIAAAAVATGTAQTPARVTGALMGSEPQFYGDMSIFNQCNAQQVPGAPYYGEGNIQTLVTFG
jgi:hypothetical protein